MPSMKRLKRKLSGQFDTADKAVQAIEKIYNDQITHLRGSFESFASGHIPKAKVKGFYPYIRFEIEQAKRVDKTLSYGFVAKPGAYETTITRPDIFGHYLHEQIRLLILNHGAKAEVGLSETSIPLHFALSDEFHLERDLSDEQVKLLPELFDQPDLTTLDDQIANATYKIQENGPSPLALFGAPRIDISLLRLRHYSGTSAEHFQNYVIFTNYQFYIDEFIRFSHNLMAPADTKEARQKRQDYIAFVEPGNKITFNHNLEGPANHDQPGVPLTRMPQMPAYHLKCADGSGITMVNIGVGPSNAKTITDHVAVLRPHAWIMLGHCAGLRNSQRLGDYVLAHAYLREDHVLDQDLHPAIPIPALAEIQKALGQAVAEVTGYDGHALKKIMRTGTVATIDDRNWEFRPSYRQNRRFSQSRAIALDMESGTIAANGFRFRVPYGALLCVSDKPLHGQLKLPGMADQFYRERVDQHLKIGLRAMQLLRDGGTDSLHSRKLRSFDEVAFQ